MHFLFTMHIIIVRAAVILVLVPVPGRVYTFMRSLVKPFHLTECIWEETRKLKETQIHIKRTDGTDVQVKKNSDLQYFPTGMQ